VFRSLRNNDIACRPTFAARIGTNGYACPRLESRVSGGGVTKAYVIAGAALLAIALVGCAGRPTGNLVVVSASAPGASAVDMMVATTRADDPVAPGVMFNGERARGLAFADIIVSIPPDETRKIGEVQWPSTIPGDPAHDFVTLRADRLDLDQAKAAFDQRLRTGPTRHVLLFVHGYNTRFEEAVYRFAQIAHDSRADIVPVLFTWPSRGQALSYFYDRESANYSRDALEAVLQAMVDDKHVGKISVLAHSLGNYVAVEALRQMAIRNHGLSPKIKDVMLASPDIDFDVFRREIAEIEKDGKAPPFTLFVSQDDKALGLSKLIAGDEPRLGAVNPTEQPYRGILEQANVHVVDLTDIASDDPANHGKFATTDVVRSIGVRLASGQKLSDGKASLGETVGQIAVGTAQVAAKATSLDFSGSQPPPPAQ
jgi:esterase/lipase superfamily enzyme